MSLQELLQPNPLDIFCNNLTAQNINSSGLSISSLIPVAMVTNAVTITMGTDWTNIPTPTLVASRSNQVSGTWNFPGNGITLVQNDSPKVSLLNISVTLLTNAPTVVISPGTQEIGIRIISSASGSISASSMAYNLTNTPNQHAMTISCSCQYFALSGENFTVQGFQTVDPSFTVNTVTLCIEYLGSI